MNQPTIQVLDIAGNAVRELTSKILRVAVVTASFFDGSRITNSSALASPIGTFEFRDISMKGYHGSTYTIEFSAAQVLPVVSEPLTIALCGTTEYGVRGTVECKACPDHATCNGTVDFLVENGFWRASRPVLLPL